MEEIVVSRRKIEKEKSTLKRISKIFWIFIIGSVIGYIIEMIVGLVQNGHFVSKQGLLFGPFSQVYGVGLVIYYLVIPCNRKWTQIFVFSMFLGGITEYIFSYFQELIFGTISWDYSNLLFNINGRTSLLHCIYWGIGGILFVKFIRPHLEKLDKLYNKKSFKIVTVIFTIFIIFDIIISSLACIRQEQRRENIPPKTNIGKFLDTYYKDEVLNNIYSNAKEI